MKMCVVTLTDLFFLVAYIKIFVMENTLKKKKNALQIEIYYDFETSNPLGSKQGIHKLGCLYFTLHSLPPHLNYSLVNIHLISLFHSQDAKKIWH